MVDRGRPSAPGVSHSCTCTVILYVGLYPFDMSRSCRKQDGMSCMTSQGCGLLARSIHTFLPCPCGSQTESEPPLKAGAVERPIVCSTMYVMRLKEQCVANLAPSESDELVMS